MPKADDAGKAGLLHSQVSFFDRLKSSLQKTKDQLFGAFEAAGPVPAGARRLRARTRRIDRPTRSRRR